MFWANASRVLVLFLLLICAGCARHSPGAAVPTGEAKPNERRLSENYLPAVQLAVLSDPTIRESSGLAASRTSRGYYWTHNDSGKEPLLFAIGRDGKDAGVWRVTGAAIDDWEDIAAGPGPDAGVNYLYIGDIGDNGADRDQIVVFRVAEPEIKPADATTSAAAPSETEPADTILLRYPDGKHNAETLLVHPRTGDLYVVTKERKSPAGVYRVKAIDLRTPEVHTLTKVAEIAVPSPTQGMVTGGDVSPDGKRVILCDYFGGYELTLPDGAPAFDSIWKEKAQVVDLGTREQGEAVGYSLDGNAVLSTSEGRPTPLFEARRK